MGIEIPGFQQLGKLPGFRPEIRCVSDDLDAHLAEFCLGVECGVAPLEVFEEVFNVVRAAQALDGFGRGDGGEALEVVAFDAFLPSLPDPFAVIELSATGSEFDVACGDGPPSGDLVMERPCDVQIQGDTVAVGRRYHESEAG